MDDLKPIYTVGQIAKAAGAPANTVRSFIQRGHLWLAPSDRAAEGNGLPRLFSLRSALRLGAMMALVRQGVEPSRAGKAASQWTETGDDARSAGAMERPPGELFPVTQGWTVLCAFPSGLAEVRCIGKGFDPLLLFVPLAHSREVGVALVLLNTVDQRVRAALPARELAA